MAEHTNIEWASATWNPWYGCEKVSAGCKNCYMFRDMKRYGRNPSVVTRASDKSFSNPLKWARTGELKPGSRIFTCSWSDFLIEEADEWREAAWSIIRATPQFDYLILTKRPERMFEKPPKNWGNGLPNVWLGVSAENQEMADRRTPILRAIPAWIRWVSAEPLLSPIDFKFPEWCDGIPSPDEIHWVVTGGESDLSNPRHMNLDWVRNIRDQCREAHIPFFHKQHGGTKKIDGTWGGRKLDGTIWNQFPASFNEAVDSPNSLYPL